MPTLFQLAATVSNRWQPGIGDPSIVGWVTVAAYLAAAILCYLNYRKAPLLAPGKAALRLKLFFLLVALLMLALAVNKQLDLQTWLTQTGKDLAKEQGWYKSRRAVQKDFVIAVGVAGAGSIVLGLVVLRGLWGSTALPLLGLTATLGYVVVRAASFHHIDHLIGDKYAGLRLNFIFEMTGIVILAVGAAVNLRKARIKPPDRADTSEAVSG